MTSAEELRSLVRPEVLRLEPYHCAREKVLEGILLDANENPFRKRRGGVLLNRYPDPHQKDLRRALAGNLGVRMENVLAGAGSDEVLDWVFKVFKTSRGVAIGEPTYGMYRVLADIYGAPVHEFRLNREFDFDSETFLMTVPDWVQVLFLCSPNNPTGNLLSAGEVRRVLERWKGLVVLDEAYIDFASSGSFCREVEDHPHLVVLRTFSKAYGRAGLRLGYAVANPEVISCFLKVKAPYNLGVAVLQEGVRAVAARQSMELQVARLVRERRRVEAALARIPAVDAVFRSDANFVLFRCPGAPQVCEELLRKGIVVRDRSSLPGLAGCIRVTVGTRRENDLFLRELAMLLRPDAHAAKRRRAPGRSVELAGLEPFSAVGGK